MPSRLLRLLAPLSFSAGLAAQSAPDPVADLLRPERRAEAMASLRQLGALGARQLLAALVAADRTRSDAAPVLGEALMDLGRGTSTVVPQLMGAFPGVSAATGDALLHALGNGVLDCPDEESETVATWLLGQAQAGRCYSMSAAAPTFAWYEYVRLRKRIDLRQRGLDVDGLQESLRSILAGRQGFAQLRLGETPGAHDLGSFGQHGTREQLEAIAELAAGLGPTAHAVTAELAEYLLPELPRPGEILTEHCAGIGENAPVDTPQVRLPTRWRRDDWRFAVARAVLAHDPEPGHRQHALRHLLHAPTAAERRHALALVRDWPRPWTAFLPDLVACLDASDRTVVRDALVLLGQIDGAAQAAAAPLQRLALGADAELATRARKLLAQPR